MTRNKLLWDEWGNNRDTYFLTYQEWLETEVLRLRPLLPALQVARRYVSWTAQDGGTARAMRDLSLVDKALSDAGAPVRRVPGPNRAG